MDDASKKILSKNIEDKLDEFFSDDNDDVEESSTSSVNNPPSLEKLKSMVLSIDWEITDECLTGLVTETENLITVYEEDRPTNALLRMLKALGNYIRKHKAQAHQEAIKRVMSVFASLETIIDGQIIDESEKKRVVISEIKAFNILKEQVGAKRSSSQPVSKNNIKNQLVKYKEIETAISDLENNFKFQIDRLKDQLATVEQEIKKTAGS